MEHPPQDYLDGARDAGALRTVAGGAVVAVHVVDPVTARPQWYVEHVDPGLTDAAGLAAVVEDLLDERPADAVLVRTADDLSGVHGWRRAKTFVRAGAATLPDRREGEAAAEDAATATGPVVRPAASSDEPVLREWLVRALVSGYEAGGESVADGADLDAVARSVLERDGRSSWVAERDGVLLGHLTVVEAVEDLRRSRVADEMADVLVEPGPDARTVQAALVAAAVTRAVGNDRCLVGDVVHPVGEDVTAFPSGVLAALLRAGWVAEESIWEHDTTTRSAVVAEGSGRG